MAAIAMAQRCPPDAVACVEVHVPSIDVEVHVPSVEVIESHAQLRQRFDHVETRWAIDSAAGFALLFD